MQGIWLNNSRPPSKVAIRRFIADGGTLDAIFIEATSPFGTEYDGLLSEAPLGRISFVGPDPYTNRKYFGTIVVTEDGVKVS